MFKLFIQCLFTKHPVHFVIHTCFILGNIYSIFAWSKASVLCYCVSLFAVGALEQSVHSNLSEHVFPFLLTATLQCPMACSVMTSLYQSCTTFFHCLHVSNTVPVEGESIHFYLPVSIESITIRNHLVLKLNSVPYTSPNVIQANLTSWYGCHSLCI